MEKSITIRNKSDKYGHKALIEGNVNSKKIYILNWANTFTQEEIQPFIDWILYWKEQGVYFQISFESVWDSLTLSTNKILSDPTTIKTNPLSQFLCQLDTYDFMLFNKSGENTWGNNGVFPKIKGLFKEGVIEISGESYHSCSYCYLLPFYDWLEKLLHSTVEKIHMYSKIAYYSPAYAEKFIFIWTNLKQWASQQQRFVHWTWYLLEDDIEYVAEVEKFLDDDKDNSYCSSEINCVSKRYWDKILL